jgi:hypothetical protein
MIRSLSTSAFGQPSETKLIEGAADFAGIFDGTADQLQAFCGKIKAA